VLTVIIVLHNSGDRVAAAIASVPPSAELVVVDNASDDDGPAVVLSARTDAHLVMLDANRGFGAGCNAGAAVAKGDQLLFLNPDAVLLIGAVQAMLAAIATEPNAVVGPAYVAADGALLANCRRRSRASQDVLELLPSAKRWMPAVARREIPLSDRIYARGGPVAYLRGACFALNRDTFDRAGGFDEDFFLYGEEETLADKVRSLGGRALFVPEGRAWHEGGTSTAKVSLFAEHHLYRSRILLYAKRDGRRVAVLTAVAISIAAITKAGVMALRAGRDPKELGYALRWLWSVESGLVAGVRHRPSRL
jgi:N-acetylglucosaminyl-diphospho-decaprenol L-rhamnosyltransferase